MQSCQLQCHLSLANQSSSCSAARHLCLEQRSFVLQPCGLAHHRMGSFLLEPRNILQILHILLEFDALGIQALHLGILVCSDHRIHPARIMVNLLGLCHLCSPLPLM